MSASDIATANTPVARRDHGSRGLKTWSRSKFRPATLELPLQTLHDRAVHLANTAFREIERGPNLFHC